MEGAGKTGISLAVSWIFPSPPSEQGTWGL